MNTGPNNRPVLAHPGTPGPAPLDRDEFTRRVLVVVGVVGLAAVVGAAVVMAADLFFLFFAAVLLAVLLRGTSDAIARWTRVSPGTAYGLLLVALAGLGGAAVYLLGTAAVAQVNQLAADLPKSADQARATLKGYPWGDEVLERVPTADDLLSGGGGAAARAGRFFTTTFGLLGNLLVLVALGLYLGADPGLYRSGVVLLVPPASRRRADQVLGTIGTQLRAWLVGRLLAMAAVGLIAGVGLWLVGVPQYLPLAVLAGLLTAVPYVGPILGAVPGVLVALMQGPAVAGWAVGVYLLAQVVENYLVTPLVQDRMVNMPPVLTVAAVAGAGGLFGVLGLVVAAPLAVALQAAVKMLYVEDVLEDDLPVRGEPDTT